MTFNPHEVLKAYSTLSKPKLFFETSLWVLPKP